MKHRAVLSLFVAALTGIGGCRSQQKVESCEKPQISSRPNFLFIYTDDQRYDAMGCVQRAQRDRGRFPWFKTPNMDRLASQGVRFENAFVVNSLCAPSRSCFLTGLYSHLNGVANNHTPMPADADDSARILGSAGYATAYIGKFHHDNQKARPGFQYIASYIGQGQYYKCPFNVNGHTETPAGWVDDVATNYAISYLENHQRKHPDQPFDMVLGFKSPHDPRTPPPRAAERFAGKHYRPVPNLNSRPPYPPGRAAWFGTWLTQKTQLDYFRCISAADDDLGRVLDALDRLHLTNNTIVIFTSDNGIYLGEHGLADKRTAYEESMRIPLILRYPGHVPAGKVVKRMVLNIDVPETLLDYAGVKIPSFMQGMSWKPLLTEKHPAWRHAFFYEYFKERHYQAPTDTAVRTDTAKLIKYLGHPEWTELYNLQKDPYETHNLIHDPADAELIQHMEQLYSTLKKQVKYRIPEYADPQVTADSK